MAYSIKLLSPHSSPQRQEKQQILALFSRLHCRQYYCSGNRSLQCPLLPAVLIPLLLLSPHQVLPLTRTMEGEGLEALVTGMGRMCERGRGRQL